MKYCFIDESGTASRKDKRPFIVAVVLFGSPEEVNCMREKIDGFKLRNNIPQSYEFHYSRNANTKKKLFLEFLKKEIKNYKVFVVQKSNEKEPLEQVADEIACYLGKDEKYRVFIDENPRLYASLKTAFRQRKVAAKVSQTGSKNEGLIQVADYLAGLESEKIRH